MYEALQQGMQQGIQQGIQQGMQEGIQQGMQEGIQQGMQQGMQQGIQEGENLLARLVGYLKRDGRLTELDQIADEKARKQLYKEYNLID